MSLPRPLLELRTAAQERAHMENGGPLSTSEWNGLINTGARKLHRILVQAFGAEYFKTSATLFTANGLKTVGLPSNFQRLLSLWWRDGTEVPRRMRRATEEEIERQWEGDGWRSGHVLTSDDDWPKYALRAGALEFVPTPTASYELICNYVPVPATLADDDDELEGYAGYEEFVIWDAVAAALAKEESDPSFAIRERDVIEADIKATAEQDHSEPLCIQDTVSWWGE